MCEGLFEGMILGARRYWSGDSVLEYEDREGRAECQVGRYRYRGRCRNLSDSGVSD